MSPCHCPGRVRGDRAFALWLQLLRWFSKGRALLPTRTCMCCVRAGVRCVRARRTRGVQRQRLGCVCGVRPWRKRSAWWRTETKIKDIPVVALALQRWVGVVPRRVRSAVELVAR